MEEHNNTTAQILENLTEQGTVSELLTNLTNNYTEIYTANENYEKTNRTLNEKIKNLEETITGLKESNMKLFLQITQKPETDQINETEPQKNELSFDDLFDENGQLK